MLIYLCDANKHLGRIQKLERVLNFPEQFS